MSQNGLMFRKLRTEAVTTNKRPRGGQPGPRGPYKPRESGPTVEQRVRIPAVHNDVIKQRGKDWLRAVIAKAVAEPQ